MDKIDKAFLDQLMLKSRESSRKRKTHNFHKIADDTLQRMLNAMQPGTYVAPHKHENPDKREAFILITGKMLVVEYDDEGNIQDHIVLCREEEKYGVEIQPRTWHSLIPLEKNTVIYEVKDGPYDPALDKQFASWAPREGDPDTSRFIQKILEELEINLD